MTQNIPKKIKHQRISLLKFQADFVNDLKTPAIALVGGLGTGKTKAAVFKTLKLLQENRGFDGVGCEPSGPQLAIYTIEMNKTCRELGVKYNYRGNGAGHPAYYEFDFGFGPQKLLLVSAINYKASLVGFNASFGFIDEFDTIENKEEAIRIWNALTDRVRVGPRQQAFVTTTPEGYRQVVEIFAEEVSQEGLVTKARPGHRVIQVATHENIHLHPSYVKKQLAKYDPVMAQAKVYGRFVNVYGQRVYPSFDRIKNSTLKTLVDFPGYPIEVGMDFNVGNMAATISVIDPKNEVYVVDEITGEQTTETMIARIIRQYPGRAIRIYPDTNGKARSVVTPATSITMLRAAFGHNSCFFNGNNPSVLKERVPSVNAMFCNALNERRCFVNIQRCPELVKGLEQQGFVDGEPDKTSGLDHVLDAFGYFIYKKFPISGKDKFIAV
jgi:hypothetical protein